MWMTGETDVGQKRKSNQDTFLTEQLSGGPACCSSVTAWAVSGVARSPADWRFPPRRKACAARSVRG